MIVMTGRRNGKTTDLIYVSAETGMYILCATREQVQHIAKMAKDLGKDIPYPICIEELPLKSRYIDKVLVDGAEDILERFIGKKIERMALNVDKEFVYEG